MLDSRFMIPGWSRVLLLTAALGLAGCSLPFGQSTAATFDGHTISSADYQARLSLYQALYKKQAASAAAGQQPPALDTAAGKANESKLEDDAIQSLVDEQLIRDEAAKEGLSVSDKEVNDDVAAARHQFDQSNQAAVTAGQKAQTFDDYLKGFGYDLGSLKVQIHARLLEQKLENKLATTRANQALALLKGGTDIAQVAKQFSDDTNAASTGGMVTLSPTQLGQVDAAVKPALDALQPGGVSTDLVRGVNGFYLLKLISRDDAGVKANVVYIYAPQAAYYRTSQRPAWFISFVTDLEKKAHIKYQVGSHKS
jgi:hypothetical protein